MNVLLVTSEIGNDGGGLALTSSQLSSILKNLGCNVEVEMSLKHDEYFAIDGGYDSKLGEKIRYSMHLKNAVERYTCDYLPDILIAYGAGLNGYFTFLLSKKLNLPYNAVLCGSDVNLSFSDGVLSFYNKITLTYAKKVVALSHELIDHAKIFDDNITSEKYHLIPNAYNFSARKVAEFPDIHRKDRIVFISGSTYLSEKKGIANLINAFSTYLKQSGRVDILKLYGKVDPDILTQYNEIIARNHLENHVEICGYLSRENFNKQFEKADIYLQLSPFEGCCNAIGEAIADGKYIFISNTGYFAEMLKIKFPQLLVSDLRPERLADSLEKYVQFIKTCDLRKKVIDHLEHKVSLESVSEKWERILFCEESKKVSEISEIVMFHDVDKNFSGIDYPVFAFEKLITLAYQKGYKLCSYNDYISASDKTNLIICTFDDAYESVYKNALPIMKKYKFTATVFVCPDLIGKSNDWNHRDEVVRFHMDKNMLIKLKHEGWEIGSHGLGHYNLLRLSQSELENTLEGSKKILAETFGDIKSFCYPYGEHKKYIRELVSKFYDVAFSVDVGGSNWYRDCYQMTRIVPEELKKILESVQ